jgi:hypothetical protein
MVILAHPTILEVTLARLGERTHTTYANTLYKLCFAPEVKLPERNIGWL